MPGEHAVRRTGDVTAGLAAVARAAIDLPAGPDADLLKECGMDERGNRVKAAAYRTRKRTPVG